MSSFILCPECERKLKVPETMAGKSFRCPACKAVISARAKPRTAESNPESDEPEIASRSRLVQKAPTSRAVPPLSRNRQPRDEELEEDLEPAEQRPIRERPSRRRRPIRKKSSAGLIIGLVAGGVVLLLVVVGIGGGLLWYFLHNRTIPQAEWQSFSPANSGCTVLMPGTPVPQTLNILGITAKTYQLERNKGKAIFGICVFEIQPQFLRPSLLEDVATHSRAGALARMDPDSRVTSETTIALGNIPGREYQIKPPGRGTLIARIYLAKFGNGHRVFLVMAGGDYIRPNTGDAARFFDSFKLDSSATPPTLDGAAGGGAAQQPPAFNPPPGNPQPNPPGPNTGRRFPRGPRRLR